MEYLVKFGILACLAVAACGRAVLEGECSCDHRFFQHYASKGCEVSQTDPCGCPTSYVCPSKNESLVAITGCLYQSIEYAVGSRIELEDKCQMCRCSHPGDPHIVCRYRECPQLEYVEGDNCHPVFEKNKCCPTRYECVIENLYTGNEVERTASFTCTYENVTYPLGAKIYSVEDPCKYCFCDEHWNSFDNSTCHVQECVFERSQHYMDRGCIPVYHETKCCPIEYYCPEDHGIVEVGTENVTENEGNVSHGSDPRFCVFAGTPYPVGATLPTNRSCVRCECRVPPDVTCVHQSCPPSPNADNCYEFFTADQCCPVYDCVQGDKAEEDYSHEDCPTPMCADASCVIGILEGHKCPTCICDESREVNELESNDDKVESQYIEVEEGPKESTDAPKSIKTASEPLRKRVPEVPIENPEFEKESAENNREIFSETFVEDIRDKEKNALQTILNNDSGERKPKSVFQNYEDTNENIRTNQEMMLNTTNEEELDTHRTANDIRRKRSHYQYNQQPASQQQWHVLQQSAGSRDSSSEREMESSRESDQNYDEVKVFSSRETNVNRESANMLTLDEHDYNNVIWRPTVPGCPTPMCSDSTCRIGVPPGSSCPTCICKKRSQP